MNDPSSTDSPEVVQPERRVGPGDNARVRRPGQVAQQGDGLGSLLVRLRKSVMSRPRVSVPASLRFPPHTFRFSLAGLIPCSPRQFVASTPSAVRKVNKVARKMNKA